MMLHKAALSPSTRVRKSMNLVLDKEMQHLQICSSSDSSKPMVDTSQFGTFGQTQPRATVMDDSIGT